MNSKSETTVVSAFIDLESKVKICRKPSSWYIGSAEEFLFKLDSNLILFVEEKYFDIMKEKTEFRKDRTMIYKIKLEQLEFYKYHSILKKTYERLIHQEPKLDYIESYSPEYLIIINSKLEFMKRAMVSNPFSNDTFMWVDFGIKTRGYDSLDLSKMNSIIRKKHENVEFGIIHHDWNDSEDNLMNGWKFVAAATFFILVSGENSEKFLKLWKEEFINQVTKGNYPTEESIFYKIWKNGSVNIDEWYGVYETLALKYQDGKERKEFSKESKQEYIQYLTEKRNKK